MATEGVYGDTKRLDNAVGIQDPPEGDTLQGHASVVSSLSSRDVVNSLLHAARMNHDGLDPFGARSIGTGVVVGLNDVIQTNPMESEAETHILRALEERDPTITPRAGSSSAGDPSFLLSQVPEDVSHSFDMEPSDANKDQTASRQETEASSRLTRAASRRPKPLEPIQRKPQDIEQQLFGLATAFRAIHAEDRVHIDSLAHDMVGGPPSLAGENQPQNAADNLAQNAGILFRRSIRSSNAHNTTDAPTNNEQTNDKDAADSKVAGSGTAKLNWGKVRANVLQHPKKNESNVCIDEDDAVDIELANACPTESGSNSNSNQSTETKAPQAYSPFFGHLNPPQMGKIVREAAKRTTSGLSNDLHVLRAFFRPRHATVLAYCKSVLLYVILPALAIAAVLFYFVDNPHTGRESHRTDGQQPSHASISWWIIFLCVRQVVTLTAALAFQALFIDFFALRTRMTLRLCGPVVTLLIVQSKGWPFTFFCWGLLDFFLLSGPGAFAHHWFYYQRWIDLFNSDNPSGNFVSSKWNYRILAIAICVSFVVAVKRVAIGLYLGRRTFGRRHSKSKRLL
jgi:hypothetical protein